MVVSALANAAIIHVGFDPTFGGSFTDLSYKGSADLTLPVGCPGSGTGILSTFSGSCNGTTLDNTTVVLFVTATPSTSESVVDSSSLSHPPVNDIVVSTTSEVIGLDTDWFDVGPAAAIGSFTGGDLYLQFVGNGHVGDTITADPQVFVALGDCTITRDDNGTTSLSGEGCNQSPNSATATFSTTPEPGSLSLLILALGALSIWTWRRGRVN